jgi:tRNA (guanine10-N2)-dimethyltransferase
VKESELFLDPFCGTGSLLIESSLMGIRSVGIDLKRWIARGAAMNLKGFGLDFEGILKSDACLEHLPFTGIDSISTDVPYGRAASTLGKTTGEIIDRFLERASEILQSGRYCVLMHPQSVAVKNNPNIFVPSEEHFMHVHRSLTRQVSVLRRS